MIHVMLQNEAKPVDQSTVELGSVAISGEVDTCSISTGCPPPKIDWEKQVSVAVCH